MVKDILIVRLSSIGDVAMATVVLEPLKSLFPESRITWVVEPGSYDVVAKNPLINRVIVWDKTLWKRYLKGFEFLKLFQAAMSFLKDLMRGYEIAIDLQGLIKSGLITYFSGAERRIGLDSKEGSSIFMTEVYRSRNDKRIASEYKQLIEKVFNFEGPLRMHIALNKDWIFKRDSLLRRFNIKNYILLCPFSSRPQKNWPLKNWASLIDKLYEEFRLPVIILGGTEEEAANKIVQSSQGRTYSMVGQLRLGESMAFIAASVAVVGVDTGLTHIAVGLSKPTVALFGSTCPYTDPDGYRMEIIYKGLACSPCKRNPICNGKYTCMKDITVEEVMSSLRRLLN